MLIGAEVAKERLGSERALVFTDIVGSTKLRQVLGDREGTDRILRHHAEARALLRKLGGGEEISTAGDGMFLCFESAVAALRFSLGLQRRLRALWPDEATPRRVRDRIGIHFGKIEVGRNPDGAKDLWGLEVDRTSRVMSLAGPDQVLLSQAAFDRARQEWNETLGHGLGPLTWVSHGFHHLEGIDQPQEIFEVGETGLASLKPPVTGDEVVQPANISGWRPAVGEQLPNTEWRLDQRLGGGPIEEVWSASESRTGGRWILRFCFRFDRLERLRQRRELFERVQGLVGAHPHIARVTACAFDHPPFYLAYEFIPGRALSVWLAEKRGNWPTEVKLELIAQLAEALEAVHRAGIVHGDLNPSAVLVTDGREGEMPRARLTRLGLGQVVADETLAAVKTLTRQLADVETPSGPRLGGYFYLAPELLQGGDPSPQSDLYALGVLMYQLLVDDLMRPVTADWSAQIADPLLREDLARCLAAAPGRRLATVGELAVRLRSLGQRQRVEHERERKAFLKGVLRTAAVAAAIVGVLVSQIKRAADQTKLAKAAAQRAEDESKRAGDNEREAERRLVRIQVALGEAKQDRGDRLGAALYYAEALRLATEAERGGTVGDDEARVHRLRIGAAMQQAPRLVQAWWFPSAVYQVIFRPGAEQVLTTHREGTAQLLDLQTGQVLRSFQHHGSVRGAVFLPGGTNLVTVGDDHAIRWWNADTGASLGELSLRGSFAKIVTSPDGQWLAISGHTNDTPVVFVLRADPKQSKPIVLEHPAEVFDVAFSPDSKELASGCDDGRARRWALGEELRELPSLEHKAGSYNAVWSVEYSPDGRQILTGSRDQSAGLWNRETGKRECYFWHDTWLTGAGFSADGSRILTTSFDGSARVWSPLPSVATTTSTTPNARGDVGFLLRLPHDHAVWQGTYSSDQRRIATACFDRGAWLWNAETGDPIAQLKHGGFVSTVRFHPDGRRVLSAASDGSLKLWDLGGMVADPPVPVVSVPEMSALRTADGARFLAAPSKEKVQIWDAAQWKPVGRAWGLPGGGSAVALDRTGERVAVEGSDHSIVVHRAVDGQSLTQPFVWPNSGEIKAAFFLEDPAELLVVDAGPPFRFVWLSLDGSGRVRIGTEDLGQQPRVFLGADGTTILTTAPTTNAMGVSRWNAHTGKSLGPVIQTTADTTVWATACREGTWLVAAPSDGSFDPRSAVLVDLTSGKRVDLPHDDGVLLGTFSPDRHLLATASEDGTARLWELPSGKLVRVLSHRHQVTALAFSANGRLLATGSRDHTARVWDLVNGEKVTPPLQHPGSVGDLWFTPDGKHLVTAWEPRSEGSSGEVSRWDLVPADLSPSDLKKLTELLDSQVVTAPKAEIPLAESEVQQRWRDLSGQHPELFRVGPLQAAAWHIIEARACAAQEHWEFSVQHWDEAERHRALSEGEAMERQIARDRLRAQSSASGKR